MYLSLTDKFVYFFSSFNWAARACFIF